jgi:hypothetical protein
MNKLIETIFVVFLSALYLNLFLLVISQFQYYTIQHFLSSIGIVVNFIGFISSIIIFIFSYKTIGNFLQSSNCELYEENDIKSIRNILRSMSYIILLIVSIINLLLISFIFINNIYI